MYGKFLITNLVLINLVSVLNLNAVEKIQPVDFSKYPLPKKVTSKSHGGELPDKLAATDGIASIIIQPLEGKKINNKEYNKLLYNNLNKLDNNNSLNDLIANGKLNINLNKLNRINNGNFKLKHPNGESCNDGNIQTINDKYHNGICKGINVEGQSCNDGNLQTINDKYHNGICKGINVEGQSCNDGNIQTINDKYHNGICKGINVEGQNCNDGNLQTINDKYHNGICKGINVEGQSCDDGNSQTINDKYHNGICKGTVANTDIYIRVKDSYSSWLVVSLNEIILYDNNNQKINYTVGQLSALNSFNSNWNKTNYFSKDNLYDGQFVDNYYGRYSSTGIFLQYDHKYVDFKLNTGNKIVKKVTVYIGNSFGYNTKRIEILDSNKNFIKGISLPNQKSLRAIDIYLN